MSTQERTDWPEVTRQKERLTQVCEVEFGCREEERGEGGSCRQV